MPALLARVLRRRPPPPELEVRAAYALWADTYPPRAHTQLMETEERAVLRLLPRSAGLRVLDVGCGSGRYLDLLRGQGPSLSVGLDVSAEMLARAARTGVHLVRGEMVALPFANLGFDLVVSGLAVGHTPDLSSFLGEIARVTRPGGIVVYSDLHPVGALAGWVRTFRAADGSEYAVAHHVHSKSDHEQACERVGLQIETMLEPEVNPPSAGGGRPAALVVRARRSR